MNILDNLKELKKLDPEKSLESIQAFPDQLVDIWQQAQKMVVPSEFKKAKNIVVAGMGGSALGGRIAKSLLESEIKIPLMVNTEYQLPAFVNRESLVVIASYSGNTEETLSCLKKARQAKAMIFGITTGGKLAGEIKRGLLGFVFKPKYNLLGYPKTAIGYSLGALLAFLAKNQLINLDDKEFIKQLEEFKKIQPQFLPQTPTSKNPAKKMAHFLQGKIGVLIASQHLKGATWALRNEINEIAHSFCLFFDLPEMNHHLVEALANPEGAKAILGYVFLNSNNYFSRVKIRYPITQKIIQKIGSKTYQYQVQSLSKLAQALEIIQLGGFTALYLSALNSQDPGPEPWIIFLKKQLAAHEKKE